MEYLKEFAKENEIELRKIVKDLCLIPAPSHHEGKRAEYCKDWLEKNGAAEVYIDETRNVIFPINCEESNQITVIAAHTDTVFPDTKPMPYEEDEEKIYSPGVGDDTVCVADLLICAKYFIEHRLKPKNGIMFVCNSCEEGLGNLKGTKYLFEKFGKRIKQFVSFDTYLHSFYDRCVGSTRYKVTVTTEGGHSYGKFGNRNAIDEIAGIIKKIYAIKVPCEEGFKTTYNVGTIEGGTSVNTIAQSVSMLCEYRSDNVEHLKFMKEKFDKIFEEANTEQVTVMVETVGERPCAVIDGKLQDEFAEYCIDYIEKAIGFRPDKSAASTDCNIPLSMGIPAVCIGTYEGSGAHIREEWITKESILPGLDASLAVVCGLVCGDDEC